MTKMTTRERYHAIMRFEPGVRTLLWEFGYWTGTAERWYKEGLQRTSYSLPPGLPLGHALFGDALPFPMHPGVVNYRDVDVHNAIGFDSGAVGIAMNWRCFPSFKEAVLEEDDSTRVLINASGITLRVRKTMDSVPQYLKWPVSDWASWEEVKRERFGLDVAGRLPDRWSAVAPSYRDRDYPLGVPMGGFFSIPRELLGDERQLTLYYDEPDLVHDINSRLCDIWLAMLEEIVSTIDLDFVYIWEDMAFKNGPLISPRFFNTFMKPYYCRLTGFLKAHGVNVIFVDTDGDCRRLIPAFLEVGVAGLYPFEAQAGMNIVDIRRQYPHLLIQGGLDKTKLAAGRASIDAELQAKLPIMLSQGGYIPFCDHLVPPDISWQDFAYYRQQVREYVERYQMQ